MIQSTKGYLDMELLRFTTAGSVDDGKSTLIGRLLYDSKSIFSDQLEALEDASKRRGEENVNLALLTDGLRAEREQGITIDVAYRYFATPKRKFIIADTPGHIQYTRNMVTGASTADVALILVDARQGIIEQTIRHTYIASLLQIPNIVVCVNKMDLVGYDKEIFYEVCRNFEFIGPSDMFKSIYFIPISALKGDNVVERSENMDWFKGISLLNWLEEIEIKKFNKNQKARFSVQYVVHSEGKNFITGRVASGFFQKGESIKILPSGEISTIQSIETFNGQKEIAYFNNSVSLVIGNNINIERGNLIVKQNELPYANNEIELMVCWFNEKPLLKTKKYIVKHATAESEIEITDIIYKVNISKLENESDVKEVKMNDIAKVKIKTKNQIYFDAYNDNRITGSLIFIDPETNETVGAGMILKSQEELSQIINEVQI